jgi:hypothetical protein
MRTAIFFKKFKRSGIGFLKYLFRKLGIGLTSHTNLVNLQEKSLDRSMQDLEFIRALGPANYELMITLLSESRSQLRQDLFVVSETKHTKIGGGGYFVDFGATN